MWGFMNNSEQKDAFTSREGMIIEWAQNGQSHDARDVILTSQNDVRVFSSDDDDDEMSIFTLKQRYKSLK